jgi:dolichol-phosphate mannosyltransferase
MLALAEIEAGLMMPQGVLSGMSASHDQATSQPKARVSLILPISAGQTLAAQQLIDYRQALCPDRSDNGRAIEVVIAATSNDLDRCRNGIGISDLVSSQLPELFTVRCVDADGDAWAPLAHAGLNASTGEHLIVMDMRRGYPPDSLARLAARLKSNDWDLAVGIPRFEETGLFAWLQLRFGRGLISRLFLGTRDIFSGLFAVRRSIWDRHGSHRSSGDSSLILELLSRHRARCVDVRIPSGGRFRSRGVGIGDVRSLKHLLDLRFGNYSRLVQFCGVGASGMIVDLSFYALFQWFFSFTGLYTLKSDVFGVSWHLAAAGALSIALALVWNFTLNRRLTFNDAPKTGIPRQFFTYLVSNALAIAFSLSVRLYLPGHVDFFARHKLAAAVVGIVAATGISFSMSRWLVFSRKSEPRILRTALKKKRRMISPSTVL